MTVSGTTVAFFLRSRRFLRVRCCYYRYCNCYCCTFWRTLSFEQRPTGFYRSYFVNLKPAPSSLFLRNFNSPYVSSTSSSDFETIVIKFLDHLTESYSNEKPMKFDKLLQNKLICRLLNDRLKIIENIKNLKELEEEDKEMKILAKEEKCNNLSELKLLDKKLIDIILENLTNDSHNDLIMELTAGVGGQEAMLFLKDLLQMYTNHFAYLGYTFEIVDISEAVQGGIRHASIMISGKGAFQKLRHEAGVHRVQRVPSTEKSGRMHTSVVSIAILPQPNEIQVKINPKDLRIDTMRASGAGGQHVNTTDSAVRITHLPTGLMVESQTQKSQLKNKETAMTKLRTKLYQIQLNEQLKNTTSMRKQQMGMGQRNEKIRTYNYSQDRITDHRLTNGTLHNLEGFMNGGEALDNLHTKLNEDLRYKLFLEAVKSVK